MCDQKDERYFVIWSAVEDGAPCVESFTKDELQRKLAEGYFGKSVSPLEAVPQDCVIDFWKIDKVLIVRGTVVVPQAREVVLTWEVE